MPIRPKDLRRAAERQARQAISETDRRFAISRAYYAAYHRCYRWDQQLPYPSSAPPHGGYHARLISRLEAPDARCGPDVAKRGQVLSKLMRDSRDRRVLADYLLSEVVDDSAVQVQLDATREVFEHCSGHES